MTFDKAKVAAASVRVKVNDGSCLGVFVSQNHILTAAHCLQWSCDGRMARGDYFSADVEDLPGTSKLEALTVVVEPVTDIAVIGDNNPHHNLVESGGPWREFTDYASRIEPLLINNREYEPFNEVVVGLPSTLF